MDLAVDLPELQMIVAHRLAEESALECSIVAGDHREAVEAENIAPLDGAGCHGVMGAVGIDARLKPGPAVHELGMGKPPGR